MSCILEVEGLREEDQHIDSYHASIVVSLVALVEGRLAFASHSLQELHMVSAATQQSILRLCLTDRKAHKLAHLFDSFAAHNADLDHMAEAVAVAVGGVQVGHA